jgi:type II secretory pathway component PulF
VPRFAYQGVNDAGDPISGVIEATDRRAALAGLAGAGRYPTVIAVQESKTAAGAPVQELKGRIAALRLPLVPKAGHLGRGRINSKDVLALTGQLSTALRAGLPLVACLQIIRQQQHKAALAKLLDTLIARVSAGEALSDALAENPCVFDPLYRAMVRVGETAGILEQTTEQLTRLLDRQEKIKTSMKNAATYPAVLLGLGVISAIVVLTWILPAIVENITGGKTLLPWPTQMLLAVSGFVKGWGWLAAIGIGAAVYGLRRAIRTPEGRFQWDRFKLRFPLLGGVLRTIAVGRFAGTLGALTKGGITILEALAVVRDTQGNEMLGREIDAVAEKVKAGEPLAEPLARSGHFPPLLVQIVSVGEQTGKLDELLLEAAKTFDAEADAAINRFMTIFPVILVLVLALIIGFIVAATLLPIVAMELSAGAA